MTRGTDDDSGARIDPALLEVLVCPVTHGPLRYDRVRNELVSHQLGRAFERWLRSHRMPKRGSSQSSTIGRLSGGGVRSSTACSSLTRWNLR